MRRLPLVLLLAVLLGADSDPIERARAAGQAAWDRGDRAEAIVSWSEGLLLARERTDREAELDLLLRLATAFRETGRLQSAMDATAEANRLAGADAGATARVAVAAGLVHLARGELRAAENRFEPAFRTFQQQGDPQGAANAALNLGLVRLARGRDAEAARAFSGALTLFTALGDSKGRADALTDLAIVERRLGALRDARAHLDEAVRLYRASADVAGEADALTNLGLVLQDLAQEDAARELYEAALATARSRRDVGRQATLLLNLGTLEHRAGRPAEARSHYAAAEEAFVRLGDTASAASVALDRAVLAGSDPAALEAVLARAGGDRRLEAAAAVNLAWALHERDPKAARRHLDRAARIVDQLQLTELAWRVSYLQAVLERAAGRADRAVPLLEQAVQSLERTRREGASLTWQMRHEQVYRALIDVYVEQGDAARAFVYAERLRVSSLPDALAEHPDLGRYREIVAEEAWLQQALSAELATLPEGATSERSDLLREQLSAMRIAFAREVDELRATHPDLLRSVRIAPEDLEAIQAELEPGVVVLEPVLLDDRLVLLVFRRDGLHARSVDVDPAELTHVVDELVRDLRRADVYDPKGTERELDRLGQWLIAPIAADLAGAHTLVVSADGPLRQLPFAALRHRGEHLVEDLAVVGVTHVGSLKRRSATDVSLRLDGPGLLLLGDPDGSLPGAEQEVRRIAERFPGATVLLGAQGTREALRHAEGKRAVHLATHGTIDPERPDRSWLTLAGPDGEDRLSYGEIPGLAPWLGECRLVVLSACESGLAVDAPRTGNEALVSIDGLAAQFRRAGVETLVASLWRVEDEATLALMDALYAELQQGSDAGSALRSAQQQLLADRRRSHPWYWAGFVVVGDWR